MAYDMSPWGQYSPPIQGAQGAPSPVSGVAAGAGAMPQMNQGYGLPLQGGIGAPGMGGLIPRPGGTMGLPFGGGGGFTNPGIMGGMFNGAGQMRPPGNPMQMLLPFILQQMGAMNRPGMGLSNGGAIGPVRPSGGPGGVNQGAVGAPGGGGGLIPRPGGTLSNGGAIGNQNPIPSGAPGGGGFGSMFGGLIPRPGGTMTDPQRILYGPSAQPYMDKSGVNMNATPEQMINPAMPNPNQTPNVGAGQMFANAGIYPGSPIVNALSNPVQNTLNNMSQMNPTQMMMAQLLRQQLPFG